MLLLNYNRDAGEEARHINTFKILGNIEGYSYGV